MEFKVWVEGIQRVVCGVTEDTTCHDVVIALAHAIGRTGRFKLTEKWRDNERLVPPSECPLKLLRSWGEYAGDVQYLLKCSGENSTRSSSGRSSCKSLRNEERYLASLAQHHQLVAPHSPPLGKKNVKRNLTFSGAHLSNSVPNPMKGRPRKPPLPPPFENSSLDSVEEQSSLSSHSSSSPYSSFQSASSASGRNGGGRGGGEGENSHHPVPERPPHYDHFKTGIPAATSSALSTPVTSPKAALTNGEGEPGCLDSLHPQGRHCQMPHQNLQSNDSNSHVEQYSLTNSIDSTATSTNNNSFQQPKVLSQSAGVSELRLRFFNGSSNQDNPMSLNSISNLKNHESSSSPTHLHSNRLTPSSKFKSNGIPNEDLDQRMFHSPFQRSEQDHHQKDSNVYNDRTDSRLLSQQHSNTSNPLDNQSYSTSSPMHLNHQNSSQQNLNYTETDENRNTKKDLSLLLGSGDLRGVCRDDLVRLVNLQIERLNAQEDELRHMESEIIVCDAADLEDESRLQSLTVACEEWTRREAATAGEVEELEIVSWSDKLEREREQQGRLTGQIQGLQQRVSSCQGEVSHHEEKCKDLLSSIKAEEALASTLESETKEKEQALLKEVSDLKEQLNQSLVEHESNEQTLGILGNEVKTLETEILERNMEIARVEKELKDSNLQVFLLKPMPSNHSDGESTEKSQHNRQTSESDIPFTRSSSSRPGNARKIPTSAIALKEAIESEPQGYWV